MQEEVNMLLSNARGAMDKAIERLKGELKKVQTGKASPATFDGVMVPYYGNPTPLQQVGNVSTSDARTIIIQPWEKNMLAPIEKAIMEANLGFTPQNDGEIIRISIPPLTEERRRDLVKRVKSLGEDAKVSIRNARREAMEGVKKAVKNGFPEDAGKTKEGEVEDLTKKHTGKVDEILAAKEQDIMTV